VVRDGWEEEVAGIEGVEEKEEETGREEKDLGDRVGVREKEEGGRIG